MAGIGNLGGSDSKTRYRDERVTGGNDNSPVSIDRQTGRNIKGSNVGGITLGKGAQAGGFDFGNIGKGATVNVTTADNSGVEDALGGLQDAIANQSDATRNAFGTLGDLGFGSLTAGEPAGAGLGTPALIIAASAVVAVALVALAIVFRK